MIDGIGPLARTITSITPSRAARTADGHDGTPAGKARVTLHGLRCGRMESLRTLLESALSDGRARLGNVRDDGTTVLTLEAAVALWAAVTAGERAEGRRPRDPGRTGVTAETGTAVRAVLRVGGHRYRVDAVGRTDVLCRVPGCPDDRLGPGVLGVCPGHLDLPREAPRTAPGDHTDPAAVRIPAWREQLRLAEERLREDDVLLRGWEEFLGGRERQFHGLVDIPGIADEPG